MLKKFMSLLPKGDLKSLPKGASALDFAFSIHTDVGLNCRGAKVNGKLVPLSQELNSGDQIEILTTAASKPNNRWLDYVITARARSKIKTALKEEEKNIAEEGKAILTRKLRHLKIPFVEKTVNELVNYFELKTSLDLFYRIGNGAIDNSQLKAFVAQRNNRFMNFFKRGLKKHPQQKSLIKRRLPVSMMNLFLETMMRNSITLSPNAVILSLVTKFLGLSQ